ncbi:class I SAM-dependent methyltransferase [Umezawaea sp. Da 62-37]|uniref:class I SAM-dependent methyltransferase n=1 Tax=Umezawaea sp. Da 62-37 TaxID=3075927 RepID=UPI0028F749C6|nr:class I SAM-dependent methyltransferase [Umezawaea sp. Da 62-37]WNV85897.1 class I SAM-dependent methyltransferase [Umezawaea sp. Da 62-37]
MAHDVGDPRGTGRFYDDLAATYDLVYADWDAGIARQAAALTPLIPPGSRVLDCACGIGTQAIGLGALGSTVVGSDLSPVAVARAAREAVARRVGLPVVAADMRALPFAAGSFDVVLAADNAVPHLLSAADLGAAAAEMRRVLRPGGRLVLSTRDYDAIRRDRPSSTAPQRNANGTVTFQLWRWNAEGTHYDLEHFQLEPRGDAWTTTVRRAAYWAVTRAELAASLSEAGFVDVTWPDTGFFQPVVTAVTPPRSAG